LFSEGNIYFVIANVCCLVSLLIALFILPLVKIYKGNLKLAKMFDINLVSIMDDYFRCAKITVP